MGVTREEAARNKELILAAAERLFRQKGIDGVGLTELMKEAGFTQGGFYNHFASKEALVTEVLKRALDEGQEQLAAAIAHSRNKGATPIVRQIEWYLSKAQRDDVECGCPTVGFAGEIPRLSKKAQASYAEALDRTYEQLTETLIEGDPKLTPRQARAQAISLYSHMVGSVLLSRSVATSNPRLANEILERDRSSMLTDLLPQKPKKS